MNWAIISLVLALSFAVGLVLGRFLRERRQREEGASE
jgi:uncharacterized protein YneF (UPF0154 family)